MLQFQYYLILSLLRAATSGLSEVRLSGYYFLISVSCSTKVLCCSRVTYIVVNIIMDAGPLRVGVNVDIQRTDGECFVGFEFEV